MSQLIQLKDSSGNIFIDNGAREYSHIGANSQSFVINKNICTLLVITSNFDTLQTVYSGSSVYLVKTTIDECALCQLKSTTLGDNNIQSCSKSGNTVTLNYQNVSNRIIYVFELGFI